MVENQYSKKCPKANYKRFNISKDKFYDRRTVEFISQLACYCSNIQLQVKISGTLKPLNVHFLNLMEK